MIQKVIQNDSEILVENQIKTTSGFWGIKNHPYPVSNPNSLKIETGDFVETEVLPGRTIVFSCMTFLIPLILFPAVYTVLRNYGELIRVLAGLAALVTGMPLVWRISRFFGRNNPKKNLPAVKRILNPEEVADFQHNSCKKCGSCTLHDC